jgi:3'(2'), 5'-bisphosphate nucleotidase
MEKLKAEHGEVEVLSRGSSLKITMVAEGAADIYPRFAPTMEWDVAAGHAIARFAGAQVVRADNGEELVYNKEELMNPWFIVRR